MLLQSFSSLLLHVWIFLIFFVKFHPRFKLLLKSGGFKSYGHPLLGTRDAILNLLSNYPEVQPLTWSLLGRRDTLIPGSKFYSLFLSHRSYLHTDSHFRKVLCTCRCQERTFGLTFLLWMTLDAPWLELSDSSLFRIPLIIFLVLYLLTHTNISRNLELDRSSSVC